MQKLPNDYSRCNNDNCPMRRTCLRYLALQEDKGIVSVANFIPYDTDKCDGFIKVEVSEQ